MMKSKNQVNLSGNGALLISHAFLAGFFGNGNLVDNRPKGPLISLQNAFAEKLNAICAMYLQPVLFNQMEYQPVWVK
jgi:hypothetical protein